MFKFDFSQNDTEQENEKSTARIAWLPASEIKVTTKQIEDEYTNDDYKKIQVCNSDIKIIRSENIVLNLTGQDHENIVKAESQNSDLLPAIYEGGLKIWECSYDLGKYLIERSGVELEGKKVLDLGCGAGVLGILTLLKGSIVHFQDYNAEVIELLTIPNVLLNLSDRRVAREKCEFYCGDWDSFAELSSIKYPKEEEKYDLIITSETIYNPANQTKLYEIFKQRLRNNGAGYVAGKTYYFGVGGGMRQFEALVREDGTFDIEIAWTSKEGLQREIMKLTWHKSQDSSQ